MQASSLIGQSPQPDGGQPLSRRFLFHSFHSQRLIWGQYSRERSGYNFQHENISAAFQNGAYAAETCRRPFKMSPLCPIEMTLPEDFSGSVWGDGTADERRGVCAARGAAGPGST